MKISILTSPFCELPPDAIGAVERRWANSASVFAERRHVVQLVGKKGDTILPDGECLVRTYVRGYRRTGSIYRDIILDFFYTIRALRQVKPCDVLIVNTFWGPIVAPIFLGKGIRDWFTMSHDSRSGI